MSVSKLTLLIAALAFADNSFSFDAATTGNIYRIEVTDGNNYGLRVALKNLPKLCGNDHNWAYLNDTDSNYKTYVSILLAAKMADKPVTIFASKETVSGNAYCHIGSIRLE
jgi:hypothetical protein